MDGFNANKKVKEKIFSNCADQHSWLKTTKTTLEKEKLKKIKKKKRNLLEAYQEASRIEGKLEN